MSDHDWITEVTNADVEPIGNDPAGEPGDEPLFDKCGTPECPCGDPTLCGTVPAPAPPASAGTQKDNT